MKIYIQSYHKNSWLWDKIVENVIQYSNLIPVIITDRLPNYYLGKCTLILSFSGKNWQQTILNFLEKTEEEIILFSFDDLFIY